jgi:hypothetical protein
MFLPTSKNKQASLKRTVQRRLIVAAGQSAGHSPPMRVRFSATERLISSTIGTSATITTASSQNTSKPEAVELQAALLSTRATWPWTRAATKVTCPLTKASSVETVLSVWRIPGKPGRHGDGHEHHRQPADQQSSPLGCAFACRCGGRGPACSCVASDAPAGVARASVD